MFFNSPDELVIAVEAEVLIAKDRKSHQRDLFESIERGDYPRRLFRSKTLSPQRRDN